MRPNLRYCQVTCPQGRILSRSSTQSLTLAPQSPGRLKTNRRISIFEPLRSASYRALRGAGNLTKRRSKNCRSWAVSFIPFGLQRLHCPTLGGSKVVSLDKQEAQNILEKAIQADINASEQRLIEMSELRPTSDPVVVNRDSTEIWSKVAADSALLIGGSSCRIHSDYITSVFMILNLMDGLVEKMAQARAPPQKAIINGLCEALSPSSVLSTGGNYSLR
jgi:hypothetical protein